MDLYIPFCQRLLHILFPLPGTVFPPFFPILVLSCSSFRTKKKKAANRNVLVEGRRLKILEKEGVTDGEEWE